MIREFLVMSKEIFAILIDDSDAIRVGVVDGNRSRVVPIVTDPQFDTPVDLPLNSNDEHHDAKSVTNNSHRQTLNSLGWSGQPVFLLLPSHHFLAARLNVSNIPKRNRRPNAFAFQMEAWLPLPAEELQFDFLSNGDEVLGVAIESKVIRDYITAFATEGVPIATILPRSLIALHALSQSPNATTADWLVLRTEKRTDLLRLSNGLPANWRTIPYSNQRMVDITINSASLHTGRELTNVHGGMNGGRKDVADANDLADSVECVECIDELSLNTLFANRQSQKAPWISFDPSRLPGGDRYATIRKPMIAMLSAACILLATLVGIMQVRTNAYQSLSTGHRQQQETIYRQHNPRGSLPSNVKLRLESEHRALAGQRNTSGLPNHDSASAFDQFHSIFARLPSNLRYRILEIKLDDGRIYLDGEARTHADADAIASSLRASNGFEIEAPRTQRLKNGKGIGFTITGKSPPTRHHVAPKLASQGAAE